MDYNVHIGQKQFRVKLKETGKGWEIQSGKKKFIFSDCRALSASLWRIFSGESASFLETSIDEERVTFWRHADKTTARVYPVQAAAEVSLKKGALKPVYPVKSLMPGLVKKIKAKKGASVQKGEGLLVLEAMKMENEIQSPVKGKIKQIHVKENHTVEAGTLLLEITPE